MNEDLFAFHFNAAGNDVSLAGLLSANHIVACAAENDTMLPVAQWITKGVRLAAPTDQDVELYARALELLARYHTRRTSLRRIGVAR